MDSFKIKLETAQKNKITPEGIEMQDIHLIFLNIISGILDSYAGKDKEYIAICLDYSFYHLNELLECYAILKLGVEAPHDTSRLDRIAELLPLPDHLRDECADKIRRYKTEKGKLSVLKKYSQKADNTLMRLKEKLEKIKREFRARKRLSKEEVQTALDFLYEEVPLIADIFCDRTDFVKRILKKKNIYRRFMGEDEYEINGSDSEGDTSHASRTQKVEASEVVNMLESIAGSSTGYTLVNGAVQSGKSSVLRCVTLFEIMQGQTCVVILRNFTADYQQMRNGLKLFNAKYQAYMRGRGYKKPKALIKTLYGGDITRCEEKFVKAFTREPKLIILLANKIQTTRLNELLDEHEEIEHFSVLIDEIDIHGYPSDTDVCTHEQIQALMKRATSVFGATATCFDVIFQEDDLKNSRLFSLPETRNYRGIPNIIFKKLAEEAKSPSRIMEKNREDYDVFESDGNLQKIYYEMAEKRPSWQKDFNSSQPIICLHKTTENTEYHSLLFNWFVTDEKLNRAYVAIIFNGNGCRVYHHSLKNKQVLIDGTESSSSEEEQELGIHLFKNTSIQEIYQWFKDNGGAKKFRKIVTISGKMAARGINFVSADYGWHLTHMYYLAAKGTPIPELIQAMRICGIYKNCCIPLKVYSTEDTIWEIKKGYNIQKDILNRARKNQKEISTKLWARDLKFNKGKIPKRQLAKGIKINKELKQVENSVRDGGMSYGLFESKIKNNISEDVWDEKYEHLRKQEEEYSSEEEEPDWEEEGDISFVGEGTLRGKVASKIFDATFTAVFNLVGAGVWVRRARVIEEMMKDDSGLKEKSIQAHLKDFGLRVNLHTKISDENKKKGLLLRKKNVEWELRVN